jgi:outer membrane lipoprotein-sorting protein
MGAWATRLAFTADRRATDTPVAAHREAASASTGPASIRAMMPSTVSRLLSVSLALATLMCGVASPARAQTIDEIVARHVEARGGAARWQAIRSIRMSGRAFAGPGREALVTRETKRPNRVRTEFTFQGITGVFAFDGTRGWQLSPLTGIVEPQALEPENTQAALDQADMEGPLVAARKKGSTLALIGQETVEGRAAYRIRVTPRTGPSQEQWIDAETYLVLRTAVPREVRGKTVQLETTFGDYRTVGGLVVPHTLEIGARGRPERVRIVVEAIELNPQIDDARFKAPSGTRR